MTRPIVGLTYRHTKSGGLYLVRALGRDEATQEEVVTYWSMETGTWTRKLSVWIERVVVDGVEMPRFALAASYYIASSLRQVEEVREVQKLMAAQGWRLSHDWTTTRPVETPAQGAQCARECVEGVEDAEVIIVLLPGGRGTHAELGMALALEKPVLLYRAPRELLLGEQSCAFYHHPRVRQVALGELPQAAFEAVQEQPTAWMERETKAQAYDDTAAMVRALLAARRTSGARINELRNRIFELEARLGPGGTAKAAEPR